MPSNATSDPTPAAAPRASAISAAGNPFNATVARITLRGLIGRRRSLLLLPLPALLLVLAIPIRQSDEVDKWTAAVVGELGVGVILPLVALILATSVLGSEIDDGSVIQLLSKPLARSDIILSKLVAVIAVTMVSTAVPVFLAGLIATGQVGGLTLGFTVGSMVGAVVYCALFVALSLLSRRAVALGLVYVLLWEGLLADLLSGTRVFSVQQYTLRIADAVASSSALQPRISLPVALIMSVAFTVVAAVVATNRLRSFSLKGESA
jgi:ABC-2 type transport system permease protein